MYDEVIGGGGGGDGRPWHRGTRLAAELDRRLAGDEPLDEVVIWWHDEWRAALRLRKVLSHGYDDIHPKNFSANEFAAFVIAVTISCDDNDRGATLHWLWPVLGVDGTKMSDATYAETVRNKFWTQLENARAASNPASGIA
jgi:hypothetical protein